MLVTNKTQDMLNTDALKEKTVSLLSPEQKVCLLLLDKWLEKDDNTIFILRGHAGTGKTTTIRKVLLKLDKHNLKAVLLAPTGRAAKVMVRNTGMEAGTIHKKIYRKKSDAVLSEFTLAHNEHSRVVFIVDEASMISDQSSDGDFIGVRLLKDLIDFAYNKKHCKLLLVGDNKQLPPVGLSDSPALNQDYISEHFGHKVRTYEFTKVHRQRQESGILANAIRLRELIHNELVMYPQLLTKGYADTFSMPKNKLTRGLSYAYKKFGIDETLIVCRSNKTANHYNRQIRSAVLGYDAELCLNDYLMVVRNNYYWSLGQKQGEFIANGDIANVCKIGAIEEKYGFRFMDVVLGFPDQLGQPKQTELACKILLDTLMMSGAGLSYQQNNQLYQAVSQQYAHLPQKNMRMQKLREDPYYNALQIKFAYAVTCHKAQGGAWKAVFIDQGYFTPDMLSLDFLRWLYTAITRASNEVYFVNFSADFFEQ